MFKFTYIAPTGAKKECECGYTNNYIIIGIDTAGAYTKHNIKVEYDHEFIIKAMKTKIKAAGGAEGLYNFLEKANAENFMNSYINKIVTMIENKEIKTY